MEFQLNQTGDALRLLFGFSEALARQREALVARDWIALQQSIKALQLAMQNIAKFPGGSEGVRRQLVDIEGQDREMANRLIENVIAERRSSSELIRLHLQRVQALQAMTSLDSDVKTYGDSGAVKGAGARLSTWV